MRSVMVLIPCILCALCAESCTPAVQVGSTTRPAVLVGPERGPIAQADVRADVWADVAAEARVASPDLVVAPRLDLSAPMAAPTTQVAEPSQETHAARDARPVQVTVQAEGSAWGLLAALALVLAALVLIVALWLRSQVARARERADSRMMIADLDDDRSVWRGNAMAVARAISYMPPGGQRDALLTEIGGRLYDREAWDAALERAGLRVRRRSRLPRSTGDSTGV